MSKRAFVGIGIVGVIAGIVGISLGVISLNNAHQQVLQSDQQMKEACQGVKDALLNPNLPQSDYQNGLEKHNNDCAGLTGRLS
jgi:hypothetical protein